jgi:hypothetical protein
LRRAIFVPKNNVSFDLFESSPADAVSAAVSRLETASHK